MVSVVFAIGYYEGMARFRSRRFGIFILLLATGISGIVLAILSVAWSIESHFSVKLPVILGLLSNSTTRLQQTDGMSSVLVLGIAGGTHDGADLTDSMLLFRMTARGSGIMTHVPRDLWSEALQDKINSAYHYGELSESGEGLRFTRGTLGSMLGFPIHHAILVDFSQFDDVIDSMGGIDVPIDMTFTDTEYPIAGKENDECDGDPMFLCRYEHVTFIKGVEHMNGSRALMYVRSRHSDGDTGTDFSRGARQQAVITALINRAKNWRTWVHPSRTYHFLMTVQSLYKTDMSNEELIDFGLRMTRILPRLRSISIEHHLKQDSSPQGQYILVPTEGWEKLREILQQM